MAAADNTGRTGRPGGQQGPKRKGRRSSSGGPTRAVIERPLRPRPDREADTLTDDVTGLDVVEADHVVSRADAPVISAEGPGGAALGTEAAADDADAPLDHAADVDDDLEGTDLDETAPADHLVTTVVADDDLTEATIGATDTDLDRAADAGSDGAAPAAATAATAPARDPDRAVRAADAALPLAALDWASGGRGSKPATKRANATPSSTGSKGPKASRGAAAPVHDGHRGRWVAIAAGVLVLGAGGAFLAFRAANDDGTTAAVTAAPTVLDTTVAPATTAAPTTAAATTAAPTTAAPATTAAPPTAAPATTAAPTAAAPATTVAPVAVDVTATAADGTPQLDFFTPIRWAIFKDGRVTLLGKVPSQAVADTIATKAAAVVGPTNVEVDYEIDPAAPVPPSAPLYVRNTVQFDPGSTVVRPEFASLLNLGVTLMQQNAGVHIWVIGRADSVGTEADNLRLSGLRADAVIDYLVGAGIDRSRLTAVPLGTGSALGDNTTEQGRALNRSVEFVIGGLLS